MANLRVVPHQTGLRYTFSVQRYNVLYRAGWKTYRAYDGIWTLPPDTFKYLSADEIVRMRKRCDSRQGESFHVACEPLSVTKTKDATQRGVYWTGLKCFHVGYPLSTVNASPVTATIGGVLFTGILVRGKGMHDYEYLLLTDKQVSISTFYKYLLFYRNYISYHPLNGMDSFDHPMPYGRDKRLDGCSTKNFSDMRVF